MQVIESVRVSVCPGGCDSYIVHHLKCARNISRHAHLHIL